MFEDNLPSRKIGVLSPLSIVVELFEFWAAAVRSTISWPKTALSVRASTINNFLIGYYSF